jgi:hypothetical protein
VCLTITEHETTVETERAIRVRTPAGAVEDLSPGHHVMQNRRR